MLAAENLSSHKTQRKLFKTFMNHDISEPIQDTFYEYLVTICYILFAKQYSMTHVGCLVFILEINPMPSTCQTFHLCFGQNFAPSCEFSSTWKASPTFTVLPLESLSHLTVQNLESLSHFTVKKLGSESVWSQADHLVSVVDASQIVMIW